MLGPAMPTQPSEKKPSTKAATRRAKTPDPFTDLIETLADVVADRVATKLAAKDQTLPKPEMVPMWLMPSHEPGTRRRPVRAGCDATIDERLRAMGFVKYGEPGYEKALREHLAWKREHESQIAMRAQVRRATRLLRQLVSVAAR